MQVARWGDELVLRLSDAEAEDLGLKEGDTVDIERVSGRLVIARGDDRRAAALARLRALGWSAPAGFRFDRDEANER
jgi:antitoxin MazE